VHGRYQFFSTEIGRIEALLASGRLSVADAGRLHFTLAGVFDKQGRIDEAFAHYRAGNERRRIGSNGGRI